jgi:8-oxo-dGTP diphosphatase
MAHTYKYPRPSVTADIVLFGLHQSYLEPSLNVLLIQRGGEPFKGQWALPGGFLDIDEDPDIEAAARRELEEETGATVDYLEQLYTFSDKDRDPRGRVITVAHFGLVRSMLVEGASDAAEAKWMPLDEAMKAELAFDHNKILSTAVQRLRGKLTYEPIGFNLLPKEFSLGQLRKLYETILGREIDKRNFRKKILAMNILVENGMQQGTSHRPAQLYRFDKRAYDKAVKNGLVFEI